MRDHSIYVDATIPVQTLTLVHGTPVSDLSREELFGAARIVQGNIKSLKDANEGVDSTVIAEEIAVLEDHLTTIRGLLDGEPAAEEAPAAE